MGSLCCSDLVYDSEYQLVATMFSVRLVFAVVASMMLCQQVFGGDPPCMKIIGEGLYKYHKGMSSRTTKLHLAECVQWCSDIRAKEGPQWNGLIWLDQGAKYKGRCQCNKNERGHVKLNNKSNRW